MEVMEEGVEEEEEEEKKVTASGAVDERVEVYN